MKWPSVATKFSLIDPWWRARSIPHKCRKVWQKHENGWEQRKCCQFPEGTFGTEICASPLLREGMSKAQEKEFCISKTIIRNKFFPFSLKLGIEFLLVSFSILLQCPFHPFVTTSLPPRMAADQDMKHPGTGILRVLNKHQNQSLFEALLPSNIKPTGTAMDGKAGAHRCRRMIHLGKEMFKSFQDQWLHCKKVSCSNQVTNTSSLTLASTLSVRGLLYKLCYKRTQTSWS